MTHDRSEHLGELLSAYLDGETHDGEAARVARHLESCGACQVEYRDLAAVRAAVRGLPLLELPSDLTSPVDEPDESRRRVRHLTLVGMAAVAAAVVGVAAITPPETTALTPQDLSAPYAARASAEVGLAAMKLPRGSMTP